MSRESKPHDWNSQEESWIADAVGSADGLLGDAHPSPEFSGRLKGDLDRAFAASVSASIHETSSCESENAKGAVRPIVRSRFKRISVGFVAAAAAVVMMVVWPAPRGYSFEAMRTKVAEEAFLRGEFTDGPDVAVAWMSRESGFAAVESTRAVWVLNEDRTLVRFHRDSETAQAVGDVSTVPANVVRVMSAISGAEDSALRVVSESWREIEIELDADIELQVRLADEASPDIQVRFGIDSNTGLPVWMKIANQGQASDSGVIALNYPGGGPTEVASLGVSASGIATVSLNPAASTVEVARVGDAIDSSIASLESSQISSDAMAIPETEMRLSPSEEKPNSLPTAEELDYATAKQRWLEGDSVDVPASTVAMTDQIAKRLAQVWESLGAQPATSADDYAMVRRVYLDLTGRIPRVSELRRAVKGGELDYAALVEELLDSPDFNTHMAAIWTRWLLPQDVDLDRFGGTAAFSDWLADEFKKKTPYDQIVRELLLAEGRVSTSGPVLFTTALEMKPDHLAKQTARAFLGTRIDCAMCHDHPYDDWSQADFWGYAALFARISRPSGRMEVISGVLRVKDVGEGEVMLPESDEVVPPKLLGGRVLDEKPGSTLRRKQLADWLTDTNNRQFARATVNKVWSHFFGAGLVEPHDDFGSHNPPLSEPLLEEFAEYFVASDYSVRELVRTIANSAAYRRSSRPASVTVTNEYPRAVFETMPVRWLDSAALYDCLTVASGGLSPVAASRRTQVGLQRVGDSQRDAFITQFGQSSGSPLVFQSGIPQALAMMNGAISSQASGEAQSRLLKGLEAPFFNDRDRVETIFLTIVGRPPSDRERDTVLGTLARFESEQEKRQQVLSDLVWALFNSAEFATNH